MKFIFGLVLISSSLSAFSTSIKEFSPYKYEVVFTNPVCKEYSYKTPILSNDGTALYGKPKNVYCKKRNDYEFNIVRPETPHFKIIETINNPDVNELFLTFLSFSNKEVAASLCSAIKRQVKVTFIIDSKNESRPSARKLLDSLNVCAQKAQNTNVSTHFRGNIKGLGFAHNKIIMAYYNSNPDKLKLIYGSANMSSGTVLHHENWHFVETNKSTHFAQAHFCVKEGMLNHAQGRSTFKKFYKKCKGDIQTEEEEDIQLYIVPAQEKESMKRITSFMKTSVKLYGAAHRISHPDVIEGMIKAKANGADVRFLVDDDIYWIGKRGQATGVNSFLEFGNIMKMVKGNIDVRYIQSNQNQRLLHHNKFLIFEDASGNSAVHTGAGNFTKSAFYKNFENYYFITIPEVVEAFKAQYEKMFNEMATTYGKMPAEYINP